MLVRFLIYVRILSFDDSTVAWICMLQHWDDGGGSSRCSWMTFVRCSIVSRALFGHMTNSFASQTLPTSLMMSKIAESKSQSRERQIYDRNGNFLDLVIQSDFVSRKSKKNRKDIDWMWSRSIRKKSPRHSMHSPRESDRTIKKYILTSVLIIWVFFGSAADWVLVVVELRYVFAL